MHTLLSTSSTSQYAIDTVAPAVGALSRRMSRNANTSDAIDTLIGRESRSTTKQEKEHVPGERRPKRRRFCHVGRRPASVVEENGGKRTDASRTPEETAQSELPVLDHDRDGPVGGLGPDRDRTRHRERDGQRERKDWHPTSAKTRWSSHAGVGYETRART